MSKDGKTQKTFDALDWLSLLTTHIPNKNKQMVRYLCFYSNKSRGLRKKAGTDDEVAALIDSGALTIALTSSICFAQHHHFFNKRIYHNIACNP